MIDKKKLLWACQKAGCPGMTEYFYTALVEGIGYDRMVKRLDTNIPYSRNGYYAALKRVRALMEGSEDDGEA